MEAHLQPSDMSLSDSVSTLDLGPPLIASELSLDHGDSSALNADIEMDPSPVDRLMIQDWVDSDWNWMPEPSETDGYATHSARRLEFAPVPSFDSLPNLELDLLPNTNSIESESERAWSSGGSSLVEADPDNGYENGEWEAAWPLYSWGPFGNSQWEVISSEGYNGLSSAEAMSSEDELWMDTTYIRPSTHRRWFTNRHSDGS
ncbi:unnamed protein product [Clonostachys rosea f. rosea IK726]|jgi:hypothetical protein|uniref:Uncharacterized protein n=1 Tax=Clonostachys rosea f. rosea IK726 TaxID=1349383 RepID=A0ACA9UE15_BIOOC|nr:unnamed protein product [Clonostachys rosea f. rosea IK726]